MEVGGAGRVRVERGVRRLLCMREPVKLFEEMFKAREPVFRNNNSMPLVLLRNGVDVAEVQIAIWSW